MKHDEVMFKILSKLDKMYGDTINLIRCRKAIEEILAEYNISEKSNELMIINNMNNMIEYYLVIKKTEGLSDKSVESYGRYLKIFSNQVMKNVSDVTEVDIRVFLSNYLKRGVKNTTVATITDILRGFFNWLEASEYIERNPIKLVKNIKTEKNLREPLTKEDLEILKNGCKTLRQKALLSVFYASGARLSEISKLKINDVDWNAKSLIVTGKGKKQRTVYLDASAYVHLKNYLNSRTDDCDSLFITAREPIKFLGVRAIEREIKKIAEQSGLNKNVFPHKLRTTVATHMINSGVSITSLQKLLGHESPETTLRYSQLSDKIVEQEYRRVM